MYEYMVKVAKVVDGDTIDVVIDLGFNTYIKRRIRFARINAYEMKGKDKALGLKAKRFVEKAIKKSHNVFIESDKIKKGKYGRYIADVYISNRPIEKSFILNDKLVEKGLAKYQKY